MRPTGVLAAKPSNNACFCSFGMASHHGVSMTPGETPFTRMGLSSTARIGTSWATAA